MIIRQTITRGVLALFCVLLPGMILSCNAVSVGQPALFNDGWRFMNAELDMSAAATGFDDSGWETVRLPHDWAITGPFDPDGDGSTAKLPWRRVGWYRNTFMLDDADAGKQVYFDFDGVMAFSKVYINGQLAGEWEYGYVSFRIDATPYVNFGQENTVAVMADTRQHASRWYSGAGIYRKVTMTIENPVHISNWGTCITPPG